MQADAATQLTAASKKYAAYFTRSSHDTYDIGDIAAGLKSKIAIRRNRIRKAITLFHPEPDAYPLPTVEIGIRIQRCERMVLV